MRLHSVIEKILVLCISISVQFTFAISEELVPTRPAPFHNLIPRFKIPPGNLLRYKIPQWEVLYYLKTSQLALKDDESFREFLRTHGYPNINQLPADALSRNNKIMEEINGLLQANSRGNWSSKEKDLGENSEQDPTFASPIFEEALIDKLNHDKPRTISDEVFARKRTNYSDQNHKNSRRNFWNTFLTRYPLAWKYTRSVVGTRNLLLNHASTWVPERLPYSSFGRNTKSFRIGTRNVNMDTGAGDEDGMQRDGGSSDSRKSGKTFQTQGW